MVPFHPVNIPLVTGRFLFLFLLLSVDWHTNNSHHCSIITHLSNLVITGTLKETNPFLLLFIASCPPTKLCSPGCVCTFKLQLVPLHLYHWMLSHCRIDLLTTTGIQCTLLPYLPNLHVNIWLLWKNQHLPPRRSSKWYIQSTAWTERKYRYGSKDMIKIMIKCVAQVLYK